MLNRYARIRIIDKYNSHVNYSISITRFGRIDLNHHFDLTPSSYRRLMYVIEKYNFTKTPHPQFIHVTQYEYQPDFKDAFETLAWRLVHDSIAATVYNDIGWCTSYEAWEVNLTMVESLFKEQGLDYRKFYEQVLQSLKDDRGFDYDED